MVRTLAASISADALSALALNLDYQQIALDHTDRHEFHRLDLAFHDILFDQLGYPRVRQTVESARSSLERARRLLSSPRRHASTLIEHRAIYASLTRRAAQAAATAMTRHLDNVLDELAVLAAEHPDLIEASA